MGLAKTCLVIDSRKAERISLDGPALRVRMHAQSSRLFPLRRLSRIHVLGDPLNGFDALIYCAERQIPVAFFTATGKLRCQLYFPVFENSIIAHWLEHVEFDVAARQQYDEWLLYQTLHLLSLMGCTHGARELRLKLVDERLNHLCKQKLGERKFQLAMEWLNGIMTVHLSQIIVNQGLADQSRGKRQLMSDVMPLYELWLRYHLSQRLDRKVLNVPAQDMSEFYQEHSEQVEYMFKRMLTQLASRLEAIV